jgi:spermidine synthase
MTFDIPGRHFRQSGTLRLLEPASADREELIRRLRRHTYRKPFAIDDQGLRRLHFDFNYVQGEMSLAQPLALTFSYTRKMMAALLFKPRPRHVLIVGLGAGSHTRWCWHYLPHSQITTLEIDPRVIALRRLFALPTPDARHRILRADAVACLARRDARADIILLDGCDEGGVVAAFRSEAFYRDLRASLTPRGVVSFNLIGQPAQTRAHLALVNRVFGGQVLVVNVPSCGNRVGYAWRGAFPQAATLHARAQQLARSTDLDFVSFARMLEAAARKRTLRGGMG